MELSVVIPTYHRNDLLRECLRALSPEIQSVKRDTYEVIVTDDGKENNAKDMIAEEFPWCSWVQGPQRGPASNRNFGASQTNGKWIVFIDDDCIPDNNILLAYKNKIHQRPQIKVFEGCIKADRDKQRFNEESPINLSGGFMWSCNIAVTRDVFEQLKGFDENFPSAAMEDVDFRERLLENAYEIVFVKDAFVVHPWRISKGITFLKKHHKSFLYFSNKNEKFRSQQNMLKFIKIYIKSWIYLFKNAFKYEFKGMLDFIVRINYDFYLKLKYILIKRKL